MYYTTKILSVNGCYDKPHPYILTRNTKMSHRWDSTTHMSKSTQTQTFKCTYMYMHVCIHAQCCVFKHALTNANVQCAHMVACSIVRSDWPVVAPCSLPFPHIQYGSMFSTNILPILFLGFFNTV